MSMKLLLQRPNGSKKDPRTSLEGSFVVNLQNANPQSLNHQGSMTLRTIWDMSFQFIFLYILIAIITGLI